MLRGCIQRNVPHFGVMLSKQQTSTPIFDLHIAGWKDGKKLCGAVYNSGSKAYFCWNSCNIDWKKIGGEVLLAASAAGITYAVASALSDFIITYGPIIIVAAA